MQKSELRVHELRALWLRSCIWLINGFTPLRLIRAYYAEMRCKSALLMAILVLGWPDYVRDLANIRGTAK